jgi:hypothetical protein
MATDLDAAVDAFRTRPFGRRPGGEPVRICRCFPDMT